MTVLLAGASGSKSGYINGIFDPITPIVFTNGQLTYEKRNDPTVCAAYCKTIESWCVQPIASKGTDVCYAFFKSNRRLEECTSGILS